MEVIWSELPDSVIESILKWLPLESVARFRTVSKGWNNHLSAEKFLTWRRENLKEDPWLLLDVGIFYYRLNVATKVLKRFPLNPSNHFITVSVGGLLLTIDSMHTARFLENPLNGTGIQIPRVNTFYRERVVVCNPEREAFVQLPMLKFNKDQVIIVGDILWKGYRYQVVAVHQTFIEVYDFPKKSWEVVQKLTPRYVCDIVFFKGLFLCIVKSSREWGTIVFRIREDCTCQMVHLYSPIPNTYHFSTPPQLLVCGSALVLVWQDKEELCMWEWQDKEELCMWKLKYDSNFQITSKALWKAIPKMPQELLSFLNSDSYTQQFTYKWLAVGEYICICREGSGNLVFFNTENRSWSCFSLHDQLENIRALVSVYVFEPRPDISFH